MVAISRWSVNRKWVETERPGLTFADVIPPFRHCLSI